MVHTYKGKTLGSFFGFSSNYQKENRHFGGVKGLITILWNPNDKVVSFLRDDISVDLYPNQLTTTTYLQKIRFDEGAPLIGFTFNREFYCIKDHDEEVSCNGIIFFGAQESPTITLPDDEVKKFDALLNVFIDEFTTRDNVQGEMLIMLLKRLIIKTTRIAKEQVIPVSIKENQVDLIRKFNLLVDTHYKSKKQVSDYADLLFKSPKTLSNLFAKYNEKTPLQIIHERIVLEAKRLLLYTDKTAKEIAYELGFEEVGTFHKLFKKVTNSTPQNFKNITTVKVGKN